MASAHFLQPLLAPRAPARRLVNRSRDITLARRIEAAFDSRTRRTGLLGRQGLSPDAVLAIAPSNAIHTFGMQFSIDVLFVSRDGTVMKRAIAMKPRRISAALRAFAVLEFTAGHAGVALTRVGDQLAVESDERPD